jgi:hypothetical protein
LRGPHPDHAISAQALHDKLRRHGITPIPGRHAAMATVTADIPAPVLTDLLRVTPNTAVRWAEPVNTDWTYDLAARDQTASNTHQD